MKTRRALIIGFTIVLISLLGSGCYQNEYLDDNLYDWENDFNNVSAVSDEDDDFCASRKETIGDGTFVLFGGATLTENSSGDDNLRSFTLTAGDPDCENELNGGMLVQSLKTVDRLSFFVNGARISIGSTVFFTVARSNGLTIQTVQGTARVTAANQTTTSIGGSRLTVPLDESFEANGAPSDLQPGQLLDEQALPTDLLEEAFEYSDLLDEDDIAVIDQYEEIFDGINVEDADELFEYLEEQDGGDIPGYLINELGYTDFDDEVEEYLQDDLGYDLENYEGYDGKEDMLNEGGDDAAPDVGENDWVENNVDVEDDEEDVGENDEWVNDDNDG